MPSSATCEDLFAAGDQPRCRADGDAGGEVAEDGAETDALEQRGRDHRAAEQQKDFGIDDRRCRHSHAIFPVLKAPVIRRLADRVARHATFARTHCTRQAGTIDGARSGVRKRARPRFRAGIQEIARNPMKNSVDASRLVDRVAALVEAARKAGADAADAVAVRGRSSSVSVRLGKVEATEVVGERRHLAARLRRQAGRQRLGDRGLRPDELAERAVAMARVSPEDPYQGLADPARLARSIRDLDLFDDTEISAERAEGGRACRGGGGACRQGRHQFRRQRRQRRARRPGARHLARLRRPVCRLALLALGQRHCRRGHGDGARLRLFLAAAFRRSRRARPTIGRKAGERAVRRLNARKAETGPVTVDLRSARGARHRRPSRRRHQRRLGRPQDQLPARHDGQADRLQRRDRDRRSAERARPGLAAVRRRRRRGRDAATWSKDGVLQHWFLSTSAARELGLETNGRGVAFAARRYRRHRPIWRSSRATRRRRS